MHDVLVGFFVYLWCIFSSQDVYRSHRPKEKLRPDSNNNENSVPIDSNSNLAARPQRPRAPPPHAKRKLDKAQSMLGKPANEVLKLPPFQPRGAPHLHNHTRARVRKPHPQAPTAPAPVGGSDREPAHGSSSPPGLEPRRAPPRCEVSGKEAISALSRAQSRECRQQIVEVYCRHRDGALMPQKVPRYCPIEGETGEHAEDTRGGQRHTGSVECLSEDRRPEKISIRIKRPFVLLQIPNGLFGEGGQKGDEGSRTFDASLD